VGTPCGTRILPARATMVLNPGSPRSAAAAALCLRDPDHRTHGFWTGLSPLSPVRLTLPIVITRTNNVISGNRPRVHHDHRHHEEVAEDMVRT
jgi:hypothetical protein